MACLQCAVDGPEDAEPDEGGGESEENVDRCSAHEADCEEEARRGARPEHAGDKLGCTCMHRSRACSWLLHGMAAVASRGVC